MYIRRLSYFVLACQQQGLAGAAAELSITPSTLSAALKTLAEEVGTPLFEQVQRRLHPSRAGLWLFRSALPILHAEEFARNWTAQDGPTSEPSHIVVDVRLSFALGRVSKAVGRAIQAFGQSHPHVFAEPRFTDARDDNGTDDAAFAAFSSRPSTIVIDAMGTTGDPIDGVEQMILSRDPWVVVRNLRSDDSGRSGPIIVPALAEALLREIGSLIEGTSGRKLFLSDDPAGALPRMLHEHADATFLMPRSMAADRLGLHTVTIEPFAPEAHSYIVARFPRRETAARALAESIRDTLASPEANLIFHPALSLRQVRYHQALCRAGSITAAARRLYVAQPALTDQLKKLESALEAKVFVRTRTGLELTERGERLRRVGAFVHERVRRIDVESARFFDGEIGQLRVGVIPSAGPGSLLLHGLASAIDTWRDRYPTMRLQILEAQSETLETMVTSGAINFAVVERRIPRLARILLAPAEPLALIFDAGAATPPSELPSFADIASLPLILPTAQSGLRQIIDDATMQVGIRLEPCFEVNSMPLLLELLRGRPVYTILPATAVQRDVAARRLSALPIDTDAPGRQFYAIHSAERNLTPAERDFIMLAKKNLVPAEQT